ncbi:C40 family peptidase [Levilactobacillus huananensis]|uniref:C40 family peptidase n=1 Tax=Levilactobacillus huananensis TaxID=2486019 RepID=UPI000F7A03CF|nr:C40 family peptidase [Levilactobacillus huananensis]
MEIRRIKVPTALVWSSPKAVGKGDQAYLKSGDLTTWLATRKPTDLQRLSDDEALVTEALFNDRVVLDQQVDGWAKVFVTRQPNRLERRGYPGWIPLSQLTESDAELDYPTTTVRLVQPNTTLLGPDKQPRLELPMGTMLTTTGQDDQWIDVLTPLGAGKIATRAAKIGVSGVNDGSRLLSLAEQFLGTPYLWGGLTPAGFDCSGLIYSLHRVLGYTIPRDASDQFANGYPVAPEELTAGDLVFFAKNHGTGDIHHVGLYAGSGCLLHAPKPGEPVQKIKMAASKLASEYAGSRRFWQ